MQDERIDFVDHLVALEKVRGQRDAALALVGKQEAERLAYAVQGYAIGILIGFLLCWVLT